MKCVTQQDGAETHTCGICYCEHEAVKEESKVKSRQLAECMEFLMWLNGYDGKTELINFRLKALFLALSLSDTELNNEST